MFAACNQGSTIRSKSGGLDEDNRLKAPNATFQPLPDRPKEQVSAFDLDDSQFMATNFVAGKQAYYDTQAISLNWTMPLNADYVQIVRCFNGADLSAAGPSTMSIRDVTLSGMTLLQKTAWFRSQHVFDVSLAASEFCTMITNGTTQNFFIDDFSPSTSSVTPTRKSLFYLLRTCINPGRLIDQNKTSSRNCSAQVALSTPDVKDYTSKYGEAALKARQEEATASNNVERLANQMRYEALATAAAYDNCATNNQQLQIAAQVRNSILMLAAIALELVMNIASIREIAKKYPTISQYIKKNKLSIAFMDTAQVGFALQGTLFGAPLKNLFSNANDMPRTCVEGYEHFKTLTLLKDQMPAALGDVAFKKYRRQMMDQGLEVQAGKDLETPN